MEPILATTKSAEPRALLRLVKRFYEGFVFPRRSRVLATYLAPLIPDGATVLDVGCGNGTVGRLIKLIKPSISIRGIEVMPRPACLIECSYFDGTTIPLPDVSVDLCVLVDVLHHTLNIEFLLREVARVARYGVLIKDHVCESQTDRALLTFMDWVGNRANGVALPYNYQSKAEWHGLFSRCRLRVASWNQALPLYPPPFSRLFGGALHCIALLEKVPITCCSSVPEKGGRS